MDTLLITGLLGGVLIGTVIGWLVRARIAADGPGSARLAATERELTAAEVERDLLRERVVDLEAAVSEDAQTAAVLTPLARTLERVESQVQQLERDRVAQLSLVEGGLTQVSQQTKELTEQTAHLAGSLRNSATRGTWGEVQLRRVLEAAGLLNRCDFDEQVSGVTRHEAAVRPDVLVRLPGGKHVVIDAKAPMNDFLTAHAPNATPAEREEYLARHAKALRRHVEALAAKDYWSAFDNTPEMVTLFVPSEAILAAALAADPGLHEAALNRKVVLVSPSTLLAMLRTVALTWQQDVVHSNAREVLNLGTELYHRLSTMGAHTAAMGRTLTKAVDSYNSLVGTFESRVLVSARRMNELGMVTEQIDELAPITTSARQVTADELTVADPPAAQLDAALDSVEGPSVRLARVMGH